MRTALLAVSLLLLCTLPAYGATSRDELIRPGIGIGKVRLGMTPAQVRGSMGVPLATAAKKGSFGRAETEWQYGFAAYVVVFAGLRGKQRVTSVTTSIRRERTAEGFGVGTAESTLLKRLDVRCERLRSAHPDATQKVELVTDKNRDCVLAGKGAETVFRTWVKPRDAYDIIITPQDWPERAEVLEVEVRAN